MADFADPINEFSTGAKSWDQFSKVVTSTVNPASWDENGGAGTLVFFDGKMIVTQTGEIHSEIDDLLSLLETARKVAAMPGDGNAEVNLLPVNVANARIERILDSRQDFVFAEVPLGDVAKRLEMQLGIVVQRDTRALLDAGVTPAAPMSIKLKLVRVREGLRDLLSPSDLEFIIDHETLLITAADVEKTKTATKLYPVKDLVGDLDSRNDDTSYDPLVKAITGSVVPAAWDANGGTGSIIPFPICKVLIISQTQPIHREIKSFMTMVRAARKQNPPPAPAPANTWSVRIYSLSHAKAAAAADEKGAEQLVDMIRKLIEPKSWSDPEAYIGAVRGQIVVRQTLANHNRIRNLIAAIDEASATKNKPVPPVGLPMSTGIPEPKPK